MFVHCGFTHSQKNYCDQLHASPYWSLTCLQSLLWHHTSRCIVACRRRQSNWCSPLSSLCLQSLPCTLCCLIIITRHKSDRLFKNNQLNAQFLYSSTICMLHYDPLHVSSSTLFILRRTNCIATVSGIVTLCKQSYSMQVESSQPAYCMAVYREWRYQRL